jgi:anaerobic ribonucleoside-triphosphate reductase
MGLFTSLCKNCDSELEWFLHAENGILCRNCGRHNTEDDLLDNFCGLDYHRNKENFLKKRKSIRERKVKIEKIKKSL